MMWAVFICVKPSAVPTGLDFARIPYPALRAGLLSAVPTGLDFARVPYPALRAGLLSARPFGTESWTGRFSRGYVRAKQAAEKPGTG
jgi:LPS sulfotransferase NodH